MNMHRIYTRYARIHAGQSGNTYREPSGPLTSANTPTRGPGTGQDGHPPGSALAFCTGLGILCTRMHRTGPPRPAFLTTTISSRRSKPTPRWPQTPATVKRLQRIATRQLGQLNYYPADVRGFWARS